VFGVTAASRNTRFQAARYGLTWAGLAPADRASLAWRLPSFDHLVGGQQMEVGVARGSGTPKMPVQLQQAARHYQFSQEAA